MKTMIEDYLSYVDKSYNELINELLLKYEPAKFDYFNELSYEKFFNGKNKTLTQNKKISRTEDGLICHHMDENIIPNISDGRTIKELNIPFKHQTKDKLVYCNLIEHMILHYLITLETKGKFGYEGYRILADQVLTYYLIPDEPDFKREWYHNIYRASYLTSEDILKLIKIMDVNIDKKLEVDNNNQELSQLTIFKREKSPEYIAAYLSFNTKMILFKNKTYFESEKQFRQIEKELIKLIEKNKVISKKGNNRKFEQSVRDIFEYYKIKELDSLFSDLRSKVELKIKYFNVLY